MENRRLGKTELEVSPLCLGTMNFGKMVVPEDAHRIIKTANELGVNFYNVADFDYGETSQTIMGEAFRNYLNRQQVILSVEICGKDMGVPHNPNLSYSYIKSACDKALERLNTDYIDLYNVPRPNPNIPIEETLMALSELQKEGKIRYYGCSTFPAWMVMESISAARLLNIDGFVTEQPPYNILERRIENELVPLVSKYGMSLIPWAPLAQGVLTGRYKDIAKLPKDSRASVLGGIYSDRVTDRGIDAWKKFHIVAQTLSLTDAQAAYAWVKERSCVAAPIVGVRTCEQLVELLKAADVKFNDNENALFDTINPSGTSIVDFYNTAPWMKMKV